MSKVVDIDRAQQEALFAEIAQGLVGVLEAFANKHDMSALSVTALGLHTMMVGLREYGGPAAKLYAMALSEGMFERNPKEATRWNTRMRNHMIKMAGYFDLLVAAKGRPH